MGVDNLNDYDSYVKSVAEELKKLDIPTIKAMAHEAGFKLAGFEKNYMILRLADRAARIKFKTDSSC